MANKKNLADVLAAITQNMQPILQQLLLNQMYLERQKKGTEHYFGEMAKYQEGQVPAEQEKIRLTQGAQVCKEIANNSVYPEQAFQNCMRALMSTKPGGRLGELPQVNMPPSPGPTPTVPALKMIPSRSQEPHITGAQGILNKLGQGTLGREKYTPTAQEFLQLSKAIGAQKALELISGVQEAESGRTTQTLRGRELDINAFKAQTAAQKEGRLAAGESGKSEAEKAKERIDLATKKVPELENLLNKKGGIYEQISETQGLLQDLESTKEKHRDDAWTKEYQNLTEKLNRLKAMRDSYEHRIEIMRPWVQRGYERFEEKPEGTETPTKASQAQSPCAKISEQLKAKGFGIEDLKRNEQLIEWLKSTGCTPADLMPYFQGSGVIKQVVRSMQTK